MKKYLIIAIFVFFPLLSHGATLDSSIISDSGNAFNEDVGVSHYPDSQLLMTYCGGGSPCNVLDLATSTILSISLVSGGSAIDSLDYSSACGAWGTANSSWVAGLESYGTSPTHTYSFNSDVHCNGTVYFHSTNDDFYVWIQYVPYDTRTAIIPNMPLTDTHFALIAGFFIFFSSMMAVLWIFKRKI